MNDIYKCVNQVAVDGSCRGMGRVECGGNIAWHIAWEDLFPAHLNGV